MEMFGHPGYLWLTALAPCLCLFYAWAARRRKRLAERFASAQALARITQNLSPARRAAKAAMLVAAVLFMALALAEPRWGTSLRVIKRTGLDMMIVLDVSKSMLAEDILPSRLARARLEARGLAETLRGDRVGLVVFAGRAFYQCPLTLDYGAFNMFLEQADTDSIPVGGTDMAQAIDTALSSFPETGAKTGRRLMIIFSDGEDHSGRLEASVEEALKRGVTIFTVPVGTPEGSPIRIKDAKTGQSVFLKDAQGNIVLSKVDPRQMADIAVKTGGGLATLTGGDNPIEKIYETTIMKMERAELESMKQKIHESRFVWPLLLALLLLVLEALTAERKKAA